jgi:hypothetical protein
MTFVPSAFLMVMLNWPRSQLWNSWIHLSYTKRVSLNESLSKWTYLSYGAWLTYIHTRNRCYDFLNIFAKKIGENIDVFPQNYG